MLWLASYVVCFAFCSSFFAALFVVLAKGNIEAAFAGAALNFAISSGGIIGFSIILATEMEVRLASILIQHPIQPQIVNDGEFVEYRSA